MQQDRPMDPEEAAEVNVAAGDASGKEERKTYNYSNGCFYDGMWRSNRRHGEGVFKWPSGAMYKGEFKNDRRNGEGEINYSDGSRYAGSWRND